MPQMNTTTFTVIYMVVIIGIFYFLLIRPQQKARKQRTEMMSNLNVNDKIYTAGGIMGKITRIKDESVWIEVADKVEIQVLKSGIGGLQNNG